MFFISMIKKLIYICIVLLIIFDIPCQLDAYFVVKQENGSQNALNNSTASESVNITESDHQILVQVSSSSPPIINETKVKEQKWKTFRLPTCEVPPNWDYFSTLISNLFVSINKKKPYIELNETFATNVKGNINLLGVISGFQANYVYFRELPLMILEKTGYSITQVEQPYYSSTCNVVSVVHRLHFKEATNGVNSRSLKLADSLPSPSFIQRLLMRRTPIHSKIRKSPTAFPTVTLEVWSWWLFNGEGKIAEYDLSFQRPGFLDWHDLFPNRLGMVEHICSEFSNKNGACSTSKLSGGFENANMCIKALSQSSISLKEVTCRYLVTFLRESFPNLACYQMGVQGKLCATSSTSFGQGINGDNDNNLIIPKTPNRVEL